MQEMTFTIGSWSIGCKNKIPNVIPQTRISEIIKGNRRVTADAAIRLSKYFGNSAKFWLGLQDDYDIEEENNLKRDDLDRIKRFEKNVA